MSREKLDQIMAEGWKSLSQIHHELNDQGVYIRMGSLRNALENICERGEAELKVNDAGHVVYRKT